MHAFSFISLLLSCCLYFSFALSQLSYAEATLLLAVFVFFISFAMLYVILLDADTPPFISLFSDDFRHFS